MLLETTHSTWWRSVDPTLDSKSSQRTSSPTNIRSGHASGLKAMLRRGMGGITSMSTGPPLQGRSSGSSAHFDTRGSNLASQGTPPNVHRTPRIDSDAGVSGRHRSSSTSSSPGPRNIRVFDSVSWSVGPSASWRAPGAWPLATPMAPRTSQMSSISAISRAIFRGLKTGIFTKISSPTHALPWPGTPLLSRPCAATNFVLGKSSSISFQTRVDVLRELSS
mmetsp:Transcript_12610/g.36061  ORF Transcript_12610/g.36061 Transcript_12610/m.36061 type:complete len:221 (-) Transcript_12610:99-761(-)